MVAGVVFISYRAVRWIVAGHLAAVQCRASQPERGKAVTDEARVQDGDTPAQDASNGAAEDAADRAIHEDRLLDGEDPHSPHADDISHWIAAYSELIAYKETLIARSNEEIGTMVSPAAVRETEKVDHTILQRELENFRRRLSFWLERREELNA